MSRLIPFLFVGVLSLGLGACELAGDLLQLGFWAGVIVLLLVIAGIWGLVRLVGGRGRRRPPPA